MIEEWVLLVKGDGPLTQQVEYLPFKQRVAGSNPARPTKKSLTSERTFHYEASTPRPHRLARSRTPAFHAGNTGSNPVGDAKEYQGAYLAVHPHACGEHGIECSYQ